MAGLSARAEKTIRLVVVSLLASGFGITAVALGSETWGYIAAAIILAGILAGPVIARVIRSN